MVLQVLYVVVWTVLAVPSAAMAYPPCWKVFEMDRRIGLVNQPSRGVGYDHMKIIITTPRFTDFPSTFGLSNDGSAVPTWLMLARKSSDSFATRIGTDCNSDGHFTECNAGRRGLHFLIDV